MAQIQRLHAEKRSLKEHVTTLQKAYGNVEQEKREVQRSAGRLEKDKTALKKTLDKVTMATEIHL